MKPPPPATKTRKVPPQSELQRNNTRPSVVFPPPLSHGVGLNSHPGTGIEDAGRHGVGWRSAYGAGSSGNRRRAHSLDTHNKISTSTHTYHTAGSVELQMPPLIDHLCHPADAWPASNKFWHSRVTGAILLFCSNRS